MSGDSEQEYFCDGLTEEIITALSKVPKVFVIARNSVFTYKGKPVKVKQVAEELGIRYVLEGSVRKGGDKLRITAQLIDALSGHHLWAERYDRDLKDIFSVQDELTKKIITAMQVELTEGEQARIDSGGTNNLQAYLKFLEAREDVNKLNIEGNTLGRKLVKEAIELDPEFAMAYRILAATHRMDVLYGVSKSPKESYSTCINLLKKAIELDGTYAEAYGALGFTFSLLGQHEKAIATAEKAIQLDPNSATTYAMLGHTFRLADRPKEAIQAYTKAIRHNPIPPTFYKFGLGFSYCLDGQYEKGIEWCKKAVQQNPEDFFARIFLTAAYSMAGQDEKARSEAKEVLRINPKYSLAKSEKRSKVKFKDKWYAALRKAGLPENPPLQLPDKPSIAVLPFDNLTGDPEQNYFSDGFTEHIITSLSNIPYILVIARQSSFAFRDKQMTVQQIAKALGVKYILEGSIQRSNDRVRITAQLIDATSGNHIWAENYDRKIKEIFSLQDEIAMKIMAELQVNIAYESHGRYATMKTTNLKAYEKIIQGGELLLRRTEGNTLQARKLAEEAIALDPEYGIAYTLLGWTHLDDIWFYRSKDRAKSLKTAEQLAQKAIELSGQDPTSHRLLGCVFMLRKQYEKAIVEMKRSVELSPNSASSIFFYGLVLRFAERYDEAIPLLEKAIRLNPVTPINYLNNLAWSYALSEQYEKAIPLWNKAIERNPDYLFAYSGLTCTYQLMGNEEKAREAAAEVLRIKPTYSTAQIEEFDIKNIEQKNRLLEAYRKAGIPE
jgi:TolB-like protein/Tfp pilus assembly protein PilF